MSTDSPSRIPSRVLGTRALAVLSCALALLAAQPTLATGRGVTTAPQIKIAGPDATNSPTKSPTLATHSAKPTRTIAQPTLFTSARQLHILATVEILHRLLAFELRPSERQLVAALIFAPTDLRTIEQPATQIQHPVTTLPATLSRERQFTLTHSQLAPPIA